MFDSVPAGFDVVLIKHFLNMFDKDDVLRILANLHASLTPGAQVHVLVPIYAEIVTETPQAILDKAQAAAKAG